MELVKSTNPILKERMPEFTGIPYSLKETSYQMVDVMNRSNGIGLAAPQVGLRLNMFVMYDDIELLICINPEVISYAAKLQTYKEGCLSFPGLYLDVNRSAEIEVKYQDLSGAEIRRKLTGLSAQCYQHELDHLKGITFDQK